MYVNIYLYTDGVARDCGAFSCSCGSASVGWWLALLCVYEYIKACFVWCVGIYMYLYIYICACGCVGGGVVVVCSCVYG